MDFSYPSFFFIRGSHLVKEQTMEGLYSCIEVWAWEDLLGGSSQDGRKWLITMVSKVSPLSRDIPLPNGLNGL